MNRRDLIKGAAVLAASPLGALTGCNGCDGSFYVWLEGPFAVVLQGYGDKIREVTAFSAVDADHLFKVYGHAGMYPLPGNYTDAGVGSYPFQYHFTLDGPGLKHTDKVSIDPDLNDFNEQHLGMIANPDYAFVRVSLPCPTNIYTSKTVHGTRGASDASSKPVCIPQDHILEYPVDDKTQPITLIYEGTHILRPDGNLFHLEVGLPLGSTHDPVRHAKHHHNSCLLQCFELPSDRKILSIGELCAPPPRLPSAIRARLDAQRKKIRKIPGDYVQTMTTTFECKTGGISGTNP